MKSLSQILLSQRVIAFNPVLADVAGDVKAGLMLSQLCYWSERTTDPNGWFWKTHEEWHTETRLTRREVDTARKRLVSLGVLNHTVRGVPPRSFYQLDWHVLEMLIKHNENNKLSNMAESAKLEADEENSSEINNLAESAKTEWRKAPKQNGGKRQNRMAESAKTEWRKAPNPLTESTAESTHRKKHDALDEEARSNVMTKDEARATYLEVMGKLAKQVRSQQH